MRVRAKANGNVLDFPQQEAEALLSTGLYEKVEDGTPVEESSDYKTRNVGPRHKRKDLRAEP